MYALATDYISSKINLKNLDTQPCCYPNNEI